MNWFYVKFRSIPKEKVSSSVSVPGDSPGSGEGLNNKDKIIRLLYEMRLDLAKWLERLTANAEVATVPSSIPASSGTVESERRQMKQC
jgi:hypothetical protein